MDVQNHKKECHESNIIWTILFAAALWAIFAFIMLSPAHAAGLQLTDGGVSSVLEIKEHPLTGP